MTAERDKRARTGADGGPTPEHAQWVRDHPSIGTSAFPEYPDEEARRGASRGAVPNGNPWRAESADDVPGPAPLASLDLTPEERAALARSKKSAVDGAMAPVASATAVQAERALAADPELAQRRLQVAAEGVGLAIRGTVASSNERERALAIVGALAGVAWVEDCLDVRSEIRPDG